MLLPEGFEHEDCRDRHIGFAGYCWTLDEAEPFEEAADHFLLSSGM
jgi:hypothetical protein